MKKETAILFFLLVSSVLAETPTGEIDDCVFTFQEYKAENWCKSKDREDCIHLHGEEWCDESVRGAAENKVLDKQLNDTYQSVIKGLEEQQRKSLRESQRSWLQFHRLECTARNDIMQRGDPVMRNNAWQSCINDFYKQRIFDLNKHFSMK